MIQKINKEIQELENKIQTWKNLSMFKDYSKEIAEAEAKILELKQQDKSASTKVEYSRIDIDRAFNKVDTVEVIEAEEYEESENNEEYDMILCTDQGLIKGTTGKQYNSYSYGVNMGRVDNERVNGEMNKFLYAEDIEERRQELLEEGLKVPSRRVLENDFKFLSQLGYVDIINSRENGVCYILKQSVDQKYFTSIPLFKWKELVISTNRNMLKLFTIISIKCNCYEFTQITHEYLCIAMDIEPTDGNQKYIGTMVNSLRKLGMIKINQKMDVWYDEEKGKKLVTKHNYYRLTTKEEYDLNNRIK